MGKQKKKNRTARAGSAPKNEYAQPFPGCQPDQSSQEEINDQLEHQTEQINETGSVTMTKGKHLIHCLSIIGQVEGHFILPPQNKTTKYEHVIPQIVAIEEDPSIEGLLIVLNTVGGDVEAGLAIAELIAGMKKPTVSLVLGGGHSIGVPLAVCARQSFIVPTATMTVHPVRMNGIVVGVPQTLSYFDRMQDRIVSFVEENSKITKERFRQLMMNTGELVMDVGTVLDGEAAVREGLIDHLGALSDAIECLYRMIEEDAARAAEDTPAPHEKSRSRRSTHKEKQAVRAPMQGGPANAQAGRGKNAAGRNDAPKKEERPAAKEQPEKHAGEKASEKRAEKSARPEEPAKRRGRPPRQAQPESPAKRRGRPPKKAQPEQPARHSGRPRRQEGEPGYASAHDRPL